MWSAASKSNQHAKKGTRRRTDDLLDPTASGGLPPTGARGGATCMSVTAVTYLLTHTIMRPHIDALHDVLSVSADVVSIRSTG